MRLFHLNKIVWVVLLCGCARTLDITNLEPASGLRGRCFSPTAPMDVYFFSQGHNQKHELLSPKALWCSQDIFMESCQKVFAVSESDEIKITKILDKKYGTSGRCWEIFATAKGKPDVTFAIPSCWVDHNPDVWVKPKYPWHQKKTQEPLQIATGFLEDVRCSF